jgi:hypothetical protein
VVKLPLQKFEEVYQAAKACGNLRYSSTYFYFQPYMRMSDQIYDLNALAHGRYSGTLWKGGWTDPRAGLRAVEKKNL